MIHQADWRSLRTPGPTNVPDRILRATERPTLDMSPGNGRGHDGMPPPRHLPSILPFPPSLSIPTIPVFPPFPALHP